MFYGLVLLTLLLAHHSLADVSELVKSGNGFVYDAPITSNLPLAPLDLANDEKTQKAFGESSTASKTTIEVDVVPSVATAASLKSQFVTYAPKTPVSSSSQTFSSTSSSSSLRGKITISTDINKKSGYNYMAPLKPFFIA